MAKDACPIIKAADPNARVLSPELAAIGRFHDDWFDNYIAAGGAPYIDVVAFHAYASAREGAGDLHDDPNHPHPVPEDILKAVAHVREKVARHPELQGKPLWNSEGSWALTNETNWGSDADEQQQAYVGRFYVLQASIGIERVYWYMYDPNGEGGCCGALIHVDGRETPAAAAYREVHHWLLGRKVSNCSPKGHIWTCALEGPAYKATIVWDDEYGKTTSYDASAFKSYRDISGAANSIGKDHNLTIGNKPVLLESGK
jgi:polysaccharide biosynthesis protein PslG